MRTWFASRSALADAAVHQDAQLLVDRLGGPAAWTTCTTVSFSSSARPGTRMVSVRDADVERTFRQLERVLTDDPSE